MEVWKERRVIKGKWKAKVFSSMHSQVLKCKIYSNNLGIKVLLVLFLFWISNLPHKERNLSFPFTGKHNHLHCTQKNKSCLAIRCETDLWSLSVGLVQHLHGSFILFKEHFMLHVASVSFWRWFFLLLKWSKLLSLQQASSCDPGINTHITSSIWSSYRCNS